MLSHYQEKKFSLQRHSLLAYFGPSFARMDRLQWSNVMLQDSEDFVHSASNVKIYDGDDKVGLV